MRSKKGKDTDGLANCSEEKKSPNGAAQRLSRECQENRGKSRLTLGVDSTRDAVDRSGVELGKGVLLVDGSLLHVSDGGSLDNVANLDTLDCLVLEE